MNSEVSNFMIFKETVIKCENGIGAKQAAVLVDGCNKFVSDIHLEQGNKKVNAKSIMGVISLALKNGDLVTVIASGEDEKIALDGVVSLFHTL